MRLCAPSPDYNMCLEGKLGHIYIYTAVQRCQRAYLQNEYEDDDDTMPLVRSLNILERELGKTKFEKVQEWGKKYHRSRKGLVKQLENLIRIARKMR